MKNKTIWLLLTACSAALLSYTCVELWLGVRSVMLYAVVTTFVLYVTLILCDGIRMSWIMGVLSLFIANVVGIIVATLKVMPWPTLDKFVMVTISATMAVIMIGCYVVGYKVCYYLEQCKKRKADALASTQEFERIKPPEVSEEN